MEKAPQVLALEIGLTAESSDRLQVIDYSGAEEDGYDAARIKAVAGRLQEIVGGGNLRMTIGSLSFPTGQALLDWLKAANTPFDLTKVTQ